MNNFRPDKPWSNPYLLLTITALIWGGNAVAGKLAVGHVSPFLLTWLRWLVAIGILLPFAIAHLKQDWQEIRKNLGYLILLGIIGFAFFNNLMYLALNYTSAINVTIEQSSMPLIVFLLNYLFYRTKVTFFQIIGFTLTLLGVVITVTRGDLGGLLIQTFNIGDLIMIAAVMFYGIYSVLLKNKPDIHLFSFMTVLGLAAFLGTTPLVVYEAASGSLIWPDFQGWCIVIYAAVFPSFVSQTLWVLGLGKLGSNRAGVFISLVPVFGALLAVLILGEAFKLYHALGMALVLGGISLAQKNAAIRPA